MKPRVLLDANILVSGLVYPGGNEHRILRMAEEGKIQLILPVFVVEETERVLRDKFSGYGALLEALLPNLGYASVPWAAIEDLLPESRRAIRDVKDAPILASIIAEKPDYAVTGDKELREDLKKYGLNRTSIFSSKQLLQEIT